MDPMGLMGMKMMCPVTRNSGKGLSLPLWPGVLAHRRTTSSARALPTRARAFTLFELLVSLALMVFVAGMAIMTMSSPLASQKLRSAAEDVRTGLGKVRNRAVREGQPYAVTGEAGATQLTVGPWTGIGLTGTGQTNVATSGDVDVSDSSAGLSGSTLNIHLPAEIVVDSLQASVDGAPESGALAQPILFFPDGTTSHAQVTVRNDRNEGITVQLHGLTGSSQISSIFFTERNARE